MSRQTSIQLSAAQERQIAALKQLGFGNLSTIFRIALDRMYRQETQMNNVDVNELVHEYRGRWIVAQYKDGRYYAPQRPEVRKLTGCHTTFGPLDYVAGDAYSYKRRSAAIRKAREIYGLDDK